MKKHKRQIVYKNTDTKCPQCGGNMNIDFEFGKALCEYCGYETMLEREETAEEKRAKAFAESEGKYRAREEYEKRERARIRKPKIIAILIVVGFFTFSLVIGFAMRYSAYKSKPEMDPFEGVTITFSGTDGYGTGRIENGKSGVSYSIPEGLSEGDVITITASSEDYRLTERETEVTVEGLSLYLTDKSQLNDNTKAFIHEITENQIKKEYDVTGSVWSSATHHHDSYSYEPVCMYILSDGGKVNKLLDIYHVVCKKGEAEADVYMCYGYTNCVITSNNLSPVSYMESKRYGNSISLGNGGADMSKYMGATTGYTSLEDVDIAMKTNSSEYTIIQKIGG